MTAMSPAAAALIEIGALLGVLLVGHVVASRHLPIEAVPLALRPRVARSLRLRPWLMALAAALTAAGLVLLVV